MTRRRKKKIIARKIYRLVGTLRFAVGLLGLDEWFASSTRHIEVTRPVIEIASLPAAWDSVRIALLSDIHYGPLVTLDRVRGIVALTNSLGADLIVLAGDLVRRSTDADPRLSAALSALRAPLGVYAVLGNHDYWRGVGPTVRALAAAGITLLYNSHRLLERDGARLCLAGVDDVWQGEPDLDAALARVPDRTVRILLCHNPDYAEQLPPAPRVDLVLSGHAHGGQIKLPVISRFFRSIRHRKYLAGLVRGPRCEVYVSRGLGVVGLPIRFRCPPELPLVTLRREAGSPRRTR
ncbi:MAG TPA: metallophosphoesterase [Phycisphaerae bacterium]|nr:metallophosphoesterase [Phycisphaerae bacterium]